MAVDRLGEMTVEETVLDVQLMNGPRPADSDAQDHPNRGGLTTGLNVSA
jgi:hypothetical protein